MIRVVIYLVIVGLLAAATVWLADRPGDVLITWQNRRIETSVMVLAVAVAAIAVFTVMLWTLDPRLMRSPETAAVPSAHAPRHARLSCGVAGPGRGRFRRRADRPPPCRGGRAHRAQRAADVAVDRAGVAIVGRPRRGRAHLPRHGVARGYAGCSGCTGSISRRSAAATVRREALSPKRRRAGARAPAWAGLAVFDARCATGDWIGALERLERNMKSGLVDRDLYRRLRAVLLTARALESDAGDDRDGARALALEAVKLAPTLVPAAALAGRLLGDAGDRRAAARIVEAAWKANPHPDLAEAYAHLQSGASARDRLARVESLAAKTPGNVEGALAVARAALDAQEFAVGPPRAGAARDRAEPARRNADGRDRGAGARRRGPRPRMDDARDPREGRSGLDRGRIALRPLDAGVAGHRPARRVRVEGSAVRLRRQPAR